MTQESTAARDEARRINEEAARGNSSAGATTDTVVGDETTARSSSPRQTSEESSTIGWGMPNWLRRMTSSHTKIVNGSSGLQQTPENMLSAGTSAVWNGFLGFIGGALKKGVISTGVSEQTYNSWFDSSNGKPKISTMAQLDSDFTKAYTEGKNGLLGILSLVGVNITNQVDTQTQTDTRVADGTNSTPSVNPSVPMGRNNNGRG